MVRVAPQLGIRSILAVPIFSAQKVAGVLEVLSNEPKRFTDRHVNALKLLARLVETLVDYASQGDGSASTLTPEPEIQSNDSGTANSRSGEADVPFLWTSKSPRQPVL